jgi:hypothetical protein
MTEKLHRYCIWEEVAAILTVPETGFYSAWIYSEHERKWIEAHEADVFTKAGVVSKASFESMFPGVGLPDGVVTDGYEDPDWLRPKKA